MSYGKFRLGVISKAEYDSEGVGYSTVQEDFPFEIGPLAFYDTLSNLAKPWGRHPTTGEPLLVTEVDRYTSTITQHGVNSSSAFATPTKDSVPAACIVVAQVTNQATILDIDNAAKHFVLGVDGPQDLHGEDLPAGLLPYQFDEPFPSARWDELRAGLIALGLSASAIDNWRSNNPDATPRDFGEAFKDFIE
jgi:hypothetical protein